MILFLDDFAFFFFERRDVRECNFLGEDIDDIVASSVGRLLDRMVWCERLPASESCRCLPWRKGLGYIRKWLGFLWCVVPHECREIAVEVVWRDVL